MSFFNTKSHKKSFSLPEISVVIAVLAFLTFTSVRSLQNVLNKTQTSVDKQKITIVKQALQTYFDTHGHLPAPADYTLTNNDANYGKSKTTKSSYDGTLDSELFFTSSNKDILPPEYQEVEYIESTGSQYIDTGILPNKTTEVEIDFLIPSASYGAPYVWPTIFGSRTTNHSSDTFALMIVNSNETMLRFSMGPRETYINNIPYEQNQKINVKASYYFFSINGIEYETNFSLTDGIYPIYLFTLNNSGYVNDYYALTGHKRIYSFKIKNNNILVRDFVPCYRRSDNVIGLYDRVSKTFFTNKGSGVFLKGSKVNVSTSNINYTMYRGIVPFKEIGLVEDDVIDSKGNFFEYYVPEIMTIPKDTTLSTIEDREFLKNGYAIKKLDSDAPYSKYPCPAKKGGIPSGICTETTSNLFGVEMVKTEIKKETIEYKIVVNNVNNVVNNVNNVNNVDEKPSIPQEYQEVEYIESTGNQWIDAGVSGTSIYGIEMNIIPMQQLTNNQSNTMCQLGGPTNNGTIGQHYDYKWYLRWQGNDYQNSSTWGYYNKTSINKIVVKDGKFYVNDSLIYSGYTGSFSNSNSNIYIFNCSDLKFPAITRLYSLKLYNNNNTLLRDFIPCYRKSDGVIGLYDKVEGKFYTNQGTGTFLKGNNVNNNTSTTQTTNTNASIPAEYQEVEYIDTNCSYNRNASNSSCPYIDTGVKTTTNGIGIDGKIVVGGTNNDDWQQIFGNRNANGKFGLWWYSGYSGLFWETDQQNSCHIASNNINHTDPFTIKITGNTFNINGYETTCANTAKNGTTNLLLFDVNDTPESVRPMKLYYWKIYDGTTIIRDFVPCYRKSDGVIGLYDKIEGKFYTNQGTGTFLKGNNVNNNTAIQTQQTQQTTESANIPSEYKKVEYIESTGTQYIDTGLSFNKYSNQGASIILDQVAQYMDSDNYSLDGLYDGGSGTFQFGVYNWHWSWDIRNTGIINSEILTDTNKHHIIVNSGTMKFNVDGNSYDLYGNPNLTRNDYYGTKNFYLFAKNDVYGLTYYSKKRIFSYKIYANNTMLRDFIPCYRKSDNMIGLYDKVEGKFYTNQGTGTFLKGKDVKNSTSTQTITKTIIKIINSSFIQPPYGLRVKNLKTEKDIEPNGSIAYLLLSHGEDGEKTCSIKRPTTIGQTPISINTLENASKINATNKFEAQNCFNAVKQDTYNLVSRSDFLTGTNKEYMFYTGKNNEDFDDIIEYSTLSELLKNGGINY